MRRHRQLASLLCAVAVIFAAVSTPAQNSETGGVVGRVYCADTQKPARFANVRLQAVEGQEGSFGGRGGFATTSSDGSFRITGVSPGEYYVDVMMPGYIQPMRGMLSSFENLSPEERDRITSQMTRVSVALNQNTNVQVMIYRGATIGGMVSFDDGAPAAGVSIQALLLAPGTVSKAAGSSSQQSFAGFARTDDRGQFRVTGLGDGTYIIFAAPRSIFPIYYGNTIERSHAKKLDVHAGDEVPGADIQIPAAGMHSVSGVVVSQQDGHTLSRASVQLRLSSGDTGTISATTASDGTFKFNAVPDGKFTVQLVNAYDPTTRMDYASSSQALEVDGSDVSDLVVNAAPRN